MSCGPGAIFVPLYFRELYPGWLKGYLAHLVLDERICEPGPVELDPDPLILNIKRLGTKIVPGYFEHKRLGTKIVPGYSCKKKKNPGVKLFLNWRFAGELGVCELFDIPFSEMGPIPVVAELGET